MQNYEFCNSMVYLDENQHKKDEYGNFKFEKEINYQESLDQSQELVTLLQKEIKRLQNVTNDLSYQLIMNGITPEIKEADRVPVDLSINPLRRRETKSLLAGVRPIEYKKANTIDTDENQSSTSTQSDLKRPMSGIRIRDQTPTKAHVKFAETPNININEHIKEKREFVSFKEASKAEKYQKERQFVEKMEKQARNTISKMNINYKNIIKKDSIKFKKNNSNNPKVMLPPLDAADEAK
jgi:hypothetical protein